MSCNLKAIRAALSLTQRDLAGIFDQTPSNISHYEAGKQELPPNCARVLIEAARIRGLDLSFDDIYGPQVGASDMAPVAPPARAIACASQSARLTADRRQLTRRDIAVDDDNSNQQGV